MRRVVAFHGRENVFGHVAVTAVGHDRDDARRLVAVILRPRFTCVAGVRRSDSTVRGMAEIVEHMLKRSVAFRGIELPGVNRN